MTVYNYLFHPPLKEGINLGHLKLEIQVQQKKL